MSMLSSGRRTVRSEINITPLVDVVLVLLIIFMVVTPLLDSGHHPVLLPHTPKPPQHGEEAGQLMIVLTSSKEMWIGEEQVTPLTLPARLGAAFSQDPGRLVVVKADGRLNFGEVKRVLVQVRNAGYKNTCLQAAPFPRS